MQWIDSHCHSTQLAAQDRETSLRSLVDSGCIALIQGGINPEEWQLQLALCSPRPLLIKVFGLHPWTIQNSEDSQLQQDWQTLHGLIDQADGLGELGLDWLKAKTAEDRHRQRKYFDMQLQLAQERQKPCVFHIVRAYPEAWRSMQVYAQGLRGLVHSFWAGRGQAKNFLDAGLLLSLPPRIRVADPHGILDYAPREQIVFESDSPQTMKNGSISSPLSARESLCHAAKLWEEDPAITAQRQTKALERIFPRLTTLSSALTAEASLLGPNV